MEHINVVDAAIQHDSNSDSMVISSITESLAHSVHDEQNEAVASHENTMSTVHIQEAGRSPTHLTVSPSIKRQYHSAFDSCQIDSDDEMWIWSDTNSDDIKWNVSDVESDHNDGYWTEIRHDWYTSNTVVEYIYTLQGKPFPEYSFVIKIGRRTAVKNILQIKCNNVIKPSNLNKSIGCFLCIKHNLRKLNFNYMLYKPLNCLMYAPQAKINTIMAKNAEVACAVNQEEVVKLTIGDLRPFRLFTRDITSTTSTSYEFCPPEKKNNKKRLFNHKQNILCRQLTAAEESMKETPGKKKKKNKIFVSVQWMYAKGNSDDMMACENANEYVDVSEEEPPLSVGDVSSVFEPVLSETEAALSDSEKLTVYTDKKCKEDKLLHMQSTLNRDHVTDVFSEDVCDLLEQTYLDVQHHSPSVDSNCLYKIFSESMNEPNQSKYVDFPQIASALDDLQLDANTEESYAYYNLSKAADLFAQGKEIEGNKLYEYGTKILDKLKINKSLESEDSDGNDTLLEYEEEKVAEKNCVVYKHECTECDRKFVKSVDLSSHMWLHKNPGLKQYTCSFCPKQFTSLRSYNIHSNFHSAGGNYINCTQCDAKFETVNQLESHSITHMEKCIFKCSHCTRKFKFKNTCTLHEKDCLTNEKYDCPVCHKKYKGLNAMRAHKSRDHKA